MDERFKPLSIEELKERYFKITKDDFDYAIGVVDKPEFMQKEFIRRWKNIPVFNRPIVKLNVGRGKMSKSSKTVWGYVENKWQPFYEEKQDNDTQTSIQLTDHYYNVLLGCAYTEFYYAYYDPMHQAFLLGEYDQNIDDRY